MTILKTIDLDSPLGPMIAIADDDVLYLLEFEARRGLKREVERLQHHKKTTITPGITAPLESIQAEVKAYFSGDLITFQTPTFLFGTAFQKEVWEALCRVPYGETRSYAAQAISIGRPTSARAVANANGSNQLAILIPCHRIITSAGTLGGYGGGIARKQWLLDHEKQVKGLGTA